MRSASLRQILPPLTVIGWVRNIENGGWPDFALWKWLVLAASLRIAVAVAYVSFDARGLVPLAGDTFALAGTDGYLQIAHSLLTHGVFGFDAFTPAHHRPPLTSLLMLPAAAWPVTWWVPWFVITTLLGLATVAIGVKLARLLALPSLSQNLWLLALVAHPYLLLPVRTTTFLPLAIMGILLWLWALLALFEQPTWRSATWLGAALALCLLTHASLITLLPVSAWAAWAAVRTAGGGAAPRARLALVLVCTTALLLTPWILRNAIAFHRFIPVATGAGYQYWKGEESAFGNRDAGERAYLAHTGHPLGVVHWGTTTPDDDALLLSLGWAHVQADPGHAIQRVLIGAVMFWMPWETGPAKAAACAALNIPLLVALAFAISRSVRRQAFTEPDHILLATVILLWTTFAIAAANTTYFPMALPPALLLLARHFR